jgi:hypothetical protein
MSFLPFNYNQKYRQLFSIRSTDNCDNSEIVELYESNTSSKEVPGTSKYYVLYRYRQDDGYFPFKSVHKFTDLISYELIEEKGRVILYIHTTFDKSQNTTQRFFACCGSKLFVISVESKLYEYLF